MHPKRMSGQWEMKLNFLKIVIYITVNHNCPKCRVVELRPNCHIHNTASEPEFQGSLQKTGTKDCKSQRIGEIACPRNVREATSEVSPIWLPKHDLKKDTTSRHANMEGEKITGITGISLK